MMKTLKEIKRRLSSVRGIMKIVGAMKMISASKLKRAQINVYGARLYGEKMKEIALQASVKEGVANHPAFIQRDKISKIILLTIAPERGFCGALAEDMFRQILNFYELMKDRMIETEIWVSGKRGARVFKTHGINFKQIDLPSAEIDGRPQIEEFSKRLFKMFINHECDQVIIAYNKFLSSLTRQVVLEMFLPVWVRPLERPLQKDMVDFIYDPDKSSVMNLLVDETLKASIEMAIAEGYASELAVRMISMDKASQNGKDMVNKLEMDYHRFRQEAITRDLLDIVGGAEALENI